MLRAPFSSLKCISMTLDHKLLLINQQDYEPIRASSGELGNYNFSWNSKSSVSEWKFGIHLLPSSKLITKVLNKIKKWFWVLCKSSASVIQWKTWNAIFRLCGWQRFTGEHTLTGPKAIRIRLYRRTFLYTW